MSSTAEEFDISRYDSGSIDMNTPKWLQAKFIATFLPHLKRAEEERGLCEEDQELRYRFLANALIAANLLPLSRRPQWADEPECLFREGIDPGGPLRLLNSGVRFLKIDDILVVQLPSFASPKDLELSMNSLNELVQSESPGTHWVIDLSNFITFDHLILANLIGFQQALSSQHSDLMLLWLRNNALPDNFLEIAKKHFSLIKKGAFLISHQA